MIVVSDTTPLNYLVLIELVGVLPQLFEHVLAPASVMFELRNPKTPQPVRNWALSPPGWLIIAEPESRLSSTKHLDAGEADAISLAKERGIADVLIDDYQGRMVVQAEGMFALPTLAVLERAAERGLIQLPAAIESLRKTTYRVRQELLDAALERDQQRRRGHH